jgi:hypothetical protein
MAPTLGPFRRKRQRYMSEHLMRYHLLPNGTTEKQRAEQRGLALDPASTSWMAESI